MVEPTVRIRPFQPTDEKLVRFIIGKSCMEPLAVANQKVYTHPLALALWVALSCVLIQAMGWWPDSEYGMLRYLSPLPVFAAMAVSLMFLCDWLNRPTFEEDTQDVLRRPDLVDIPSYYSRSASSGFWLLEYGDKFVGLIAVDASLDSTSDKGVASSMLSSANVRQRAGIRQRKLSLAKGTSSVATIRHFYVEELYRQAGMQHDLLAHAVKHPFSYDENVQGIRASSSPLEPHVEEALRNVGFRVEQKSQKRGVMRWQSSVWILDRAGWKK
ncbi:hypothetical protein WOLCODRAFT_135209 [Wolfiporia cocos MD-104 SS10]|uniref:N-acetyltransferase domain-containing protein n=1 Tax=Wolfiporia cocos (strain MD-104) TaxID=742152 RepID=A0A2H3IW04_WOLCO|nr:hypothetical protein WOLCODRAFT_135209 [Wolfiporia cocos MD-104 SS10]